jgi:hypothetical protein
MYAFGDTGSENFLQCGKYIYKRGVGNWVNKAFCQFPFLISFHCIAFQQMFANVSKGFPRYSWGYVPYYLKHRIPKLAGMF